MTPTPTNEPIYVKVGRREALGPALVLALEDVPLGALIEELRRRESAQLERRERRRKARVYCHECRHFITGSGKDAGTCALGKRLTFHAPADSIETFDGDFGFFRRDCPDRDET